ncbi:MAG TPA: Hpt domain-containing protein, partial [Pirellulaceae bacterium]|nr:Hpt domain-containing protein [Pirellulaceae bacterium]
MNNDQPSANDEMQDELLTDFIDEASQLLDRLNEDLLVLDEWASAHGSTDHGRCDDALMNNMFRSAHSIKGLSAMLGLANVNRLTHRVENIFDAARKDELKLNQQVVQVVFEAIDHLSEMVTMLRTEGHDEHDATKVVADIQELLQGAGCERKTTTQADAEQALGALLSQLDPSPASHSPGELPSAFTAGISMVFSEASTLADHFAGLVDETEVPAKYLAIFIDETELSLDSIADSLVGAQQQDRHATIENLLITSHRIKGSAASIGLHRPAKLAHLMEDILQELRETSAALTAEMTDAMLHCTDALRAYVVGLKSGEAPAERFSQLADSLTRAHAQAFQTAKAKCPVTDVSTPKAVAPPVVDGAQLLSNIAARHRGQHLLVVGRVKFVTGLALVGLKARLIFEKLSHQGDLLECTPSKDNCDDLETLDELTFALTTEASLSQIKAKAFVAGVDTVELLDCREAIKSQPIPVATPTKLATPTRIESPVATPVAPEEPAAQHDLHDAPSTKSRAGGETTNKPNETLRVDIERLDQLMNLAGQLVINKARFAQIGEGLKETMIGKQTPQLVTNVANLARKLMAETERLTPTGKPAADMETIRSHTRRLQANIELLQRELTRVSQQRNRVNDLFEAVHQLDRVADGIQKSVMDTRMVPIGPLFGRFKRVVRDITRLNNKDVNLVIRGEKTELDKRMIDELGDPLIHMVRNAADHGIESSAARLAAGKPSQGTLTLDAFHRGNSIIIQV